VTLNEFKKRVLEHSGIDLGFYQHSVVNRRIDNIMQKLRVDDLDSLWEIISSSEKEFRRFADFITINVTEFFRDSKKFEYLQKKIFPEILKITTEPLIWSAACSTGDEAYSIAIILEELGLKKTVKILATDVDSEAIRKAEKGIYEEANLKNISNLRKSRFFVRQDRQFIVNEYIKNRVKFKHHDLLKDPFPSDRFHLIVCRNVIIHFEHGIKKDLYKRFHASLKKGGFLFLGGVEKIINPEEIGFEAWEEGVYRKISNF
jgi:chemotaxis protein methyltransferase CheR